MQRNQRRGLRSDPCRAGHRNRRDAKCLGVGRRAPAGATRPTVPLRPHDHVLAPHPQPDHAPTPAIIRRAARPAPEAEQLCENHCSASKPRIPSTRSNGTWQRWRPRRPDASARPMCEHSYPARQRVGICRRALSTASGAMQNLAMHRGPKRVAPSLATLRCACARRGALLACCDARRWPARRRSATLRFETPQKRALGPPLWGARVRGMQRWRKTPTDEVIAVSCVGRLLSLFASWYACRLLSRRTALAN